MIFREATIEERPFLFQEGYKEWPKNRTFEQYCFDNSKDDINGIRYILDEGGQIVCSAVILQLESIDERTVYGFGSILTSQCFRGKGYGVELVKKCIALNCNENTIIILYSDINPSYYKKLGFRILPQELQKYPKSICMAYCEDNAWHELINVNKDIIPDYF